MYSCKNCPHLRAIFKFILFDQFGFACLYCFFKKFLSETENLYSVFAHFVIVRVYLSLSSQLREGASKARARGLLMVKTVNKYTLNSLVSDLFCDRQHT